MCVTLDIDLPQASIVEWCIPIARTSTSSSDSRSLPVIRVPLYLRQRPSSNSFGSPTITRHFATDSLRMIW